MLCWSNEDEARVYIKELVAKFYHDFKEKENHISQEIRFPMHQGYLMKRKCKVLQTLC